MSRISRPYAEEPDLQRLIALEQTITAGCWPRPTYWHVGDLVWNFYAANGGIADDNIRLWLDGAEIIAFVAFSAPAEVHIDLRPDIPDARAVLDEVYDWAERRAQQASQKGDILRLGTSVLEGIKPGWKWCDRAAIGERSSEGFVCAEVSAIPSMNLNCLLL